MIVRTNSTAARIVPPTQPQPIRSMNPQVSYYSSDETYNLDSEIAEDLKNYLGYNPSSWVIFHVNNSMKAYSMSHIDGKGYELLLRGCSSVGRARA